MDNKLILRKVDVTDDVLDTPISEVIKLLQGFPEDAELSHEVEYAYGDEYHHIEVQWYDAETDAEAHQRRIDELDKHRKHLIGTCTMVIDSGLQVPQELKDKLDDVRTRLKEMKGQ